LAALSSNNLPMNRRKAIKSFFVVGGTITLSYTGFHWLQLQSTPDFLFLEKNLLLIGHLAETIIPQTNTPGALQANVAPVIVKNIKDCCDKKTQHHFINGLKAIAHYAEEAYHLPFPQLSFLQQTACLQAFQQKEKFRLGMAGKIKNKILGKPFFALLKEYTTMAYCSSMKGAQEGLAYQYIPGSYQSCLPLQPSQKAWATK
jgi:hypothetical protein